MQITITKTGDWRRAEKALDRRHRRAAISHAVGDEIVYLKGKAVAAFDTAGASNNRPWPPKKGGGQAFKNSKIVDQLRHIHPPRALSGWVYFPKGAKFTGGKGSAMAGLAAHEEGKVFTITVTRKMLQFMHARRRGGAGGGGSGQKLKVGAVLVIRIPRRSFLVDTLEAHGDSKAQTRFAHSMQRRLGHLGWRVV